MADFNPDDYLAQKTQSQGGDFNPDKYLQEKSAPSDSKDQKPAPEWSKLESLGQGALQGITGGFSDEIGGAAGALMEKGADLIGKGTGDKKSLKELYQQYRDMHRQKNKEAEEANPKSYLAGNIGGGIAGAALAPELLAPKSVAGAAGLGAAVGLGSSNADLTDPSLQNIQQAAKDTAVGAGLGAAGGAIGNKLAGKINPEELETASSKLASSAVGLKPSKELTSLYNPATKQIEKGSNVIKGIGSTALENNALPFTGGPAGMYDQSLKAIENKYSQLNPIFSETQQKLNQNLPQYTEAAGNIGDKAADFLYKFRDSLSNDPDQDTIMKKIEEKYVPYIQKLSDSDGNLQQLNAYKKGLQQKAQDLSSAAYNQPASDLKPEAAFVKSLGGVVRQHIEDLASAANPGAGDQIGTINKDLGNLYTYNTAAKKLMDKSSNSLTDQATTGAGIGLGFLAGGPMGAAATGLGKVALEGSTGNPIGRLAKIGGAKALGAAAKAIDTPSGQLVQKSLQQVPSKILTNPFSQEKIQGKSVGPAQATKLTTSLYNATDDSLKGVAAKFRETPGLEFYADHLDKAIDTNDQGEKNRAIFLISQNPLTRKLVSPEDNG